MILRAALPTARGAVAAVRIALTVAATVWIVHFFLRHRQELEQAAAEMDGAVVVLAMVCVLTGLVPGAWAWHRLLAREVPTVSASRGILVYLRSGIGKYTPGGLLAFAIQHRLLEREGAGPGLLLRVFIGTALAACLAAALIGVPAAVGVVGEWAWWLIIHGCDVGAAALGWAWQRGSWPLCAGLLARIGVPAPGPFIATTAIMAAAWATTGTHLAVLGIATDASPLFLISAYAFSAIAGIVFAVLPGAFGVRDGVLLYILSVQLAPAEALVLALVSRALIVAGDAIGTAAAALALGWTVPEPSIERKVQ